MPQFMYGVEDLPMASTGISKVRQVLRDHEFEIAAELGLPHEPDTKAAPSVRDSAGYPSQSPADGEAPACRLGALPRR